MLSRIREKWHVLAVAAAFAVALGAVAYSQGYYLPSGATVQYNFYTNAIGAPPTCTNCTIQSGSSDFFGQLSVTSTGAVTLTFGTAYTNAPWCVMSDNTAHEGIINTQSTSASTITGGVSSDLISWICVGH